MSQKVHYVTNSESSPSLSEVLTEVFGSTFERADLTQLLALMESISFLMRQPDASIGNAVTAVIPDVTMPIKLHFCGTKLMNYREGLTLMAVIYTVTEGKIALLDSDEMIAYH